MESSNAIAQDTMMSIVNGTMNLIADEQTIRLADKMFPVRSDVYMAV